MLQSTVLFAAPIATGGSYIADWYGPLISSASFQKQSFGRYWALNLALRCDQTVIEEWLERGLGRHVACYDTGLSVAWEGFVNSISGSIGQRSVAVGPLLGGVANRMRVVFSYIDMMTGQPLLGGRAYTAWANDTDSQARYGVIERVMSIAGSTDTIATQIRDLALVEAAWPQVMESESWGTTSEPVLYLECLGYIHWLDAYIYNSTLTGPANADVKLQNVLAADPNGIFSADYSRINVNTTQVGQWEDEDRTAMQVAKAIVSQGDATLNRWMLYLRPERVACYHTQPTTVMYQRSLKDPDQAVRRAAGMAQVEPWQVLPGQWTFYSDFMIGESAATLEADRRYTFIEQARLQAPWNLSIQGQLDFRLNRLLARLGLGGTTL